MEPSDAPLLPTGSRLGRYEIVRRLGHGGMAEVFEARHADLGKRVAVKVMHPAFAGDAFAVSRLLREGRAATAIHHPHVVSVIDVGTERGTPYLVMELLDGEDLAQRLTREGPLSMQTAADLLLPVISGIAAVHAAGVVHRDLKPSNIFLAKRHRGIEPVVVDFGISKIIAPTASRPTGSLGAAGTALYMAPEQVRGAGDVTAKADQYALGVLLYECTTGGTPYWGEDYYELLHAIMTAPLVPPSELHPALTPSFDALVARALARDPERRFADVRALGAALLAFASADVRRAWEAELSVATARDDLAAPAIETRSRVDGSVRGRWRRVAVPLAGVALAAVAASRVATTRARHVEATRAEAAPSARAEIAASGPAFVPHAVISAAPPPSAPPSFVAPAAHIAHIAPRSVSPAVKRVSPSPPSPPSSHRALARGDNGVPILEVE